MSMLYAYKPLKDRALRSTAGILLSAGITPNMVTIFGLLICSISGIIAISGNLYTAIIVFLAGAFIDAIDGSLARVSGLCTEFGKYLDSICDRFSEFFLIAGAVLGGAPASAFLVIAGSIALLLSRIYNHRKGLDSNSAMFGRPERLFLLITGLMFSEQYSTAIFVVTFILCIVSSCQALISGINRNAMKTVNGEAQDN
jgi:phosphatidylglycerophosphate synthase